MTKASDYAELVRQRKTCRRCCPGLANAADIDKGARDWKEIGGWSQWQGNLGASFMVVGQDWAGIPYFLKHKGRDDPRNATNRAIVELAREAGVSIDELGLSQGQGTAFFTNAILCLKNGQLSAAVKRRWFDNCSSFLRRQIEIVRPEVVVGLGVHAYRSILGCFGMTPGPVFRSEVERKDGRMLPNGVRVFAVYHCSPLVWNTGTRTLDEQKKDWRRMGPHFSAPNSTTGLS
jgi:uracil-DNA glycosylase family 4